MGRGLFSGMLKNIESAGEKITDTRREGFDLKFSLTDALKSALAVFFISASVYAGVSEKDERAAQAKQSGNNNAGGQNPEQCADNKLA
jgi:ADP-heptose:LPS heptosyltransferase